MQTMWSKQRGAKQAQAEVLGGVGGWQAGKTLKGSHILRDKRETIFFYYLKKTLVTEYGQPGGQC